MTVGQLILLLQMWDPKETVLIGRYQPIPPHKMHDAPVADLVTVEQGRNGVVLTHGPKDVRVR